MTSGLSSDDSLGSGGRTRRKTRSAYESDLWLLPDDEPAGAVVPADEATDVEGFIAYPCPVLPADELAKCQEHELLRDAQCYAVQCGLSRIEREYGAMPLPMQLLSVSSELTLSDEAAATPLLEKIVELAESESNCLYCGWTRCGDKLYLREAFGSVVGIARHADGIDDTLKALTSGPATLDATHLHTALPNIRLFDEYISDTKRESGYCSAETTKWYNEEGAVQKYDVQQSLFGFYFKR